MRRWLFVAALAGCPSSTTVPNLAMGDMAGQMPDMATPPSGGEEKTAAKLDSLVNDPAGLAAFLMAMPKGGDLHNHLSGAVYAETYLTWGLADNDCINSTTFAAVNAG